MSLFVMKAKTNCGFNKITEFGCLTMFIVTYDNNQKKIKIMLVKLITYWCFKL